MRRLYVIKNKRGQYLTVPRVDEPIITSKWSKSFKKARIYMNNSYANMSVKAVREVFGDSSCYVVGCDLTEDLK